MAKYLKINGKVCLDSWRGMLRAQNVGFLQTNLLIINFETKTLHNTLDSLVNHFIYRTFSIDKNHGSHVFQSAKLRELPLNLLSVQFLLPTVNHIS